MTGPIAGLVGPCRRGPPGGFGGLQPGDGQQVVRRRRPHLRDGRGGRPEDRRDRTADPSDPLREEARHLVRTDERLPVPQRLLAQERALADLLPQRDESALVGPIGEPPQGLDVDRLVVGVVGDPVEALAEAGERTGQGAGRQFDARFPVGPQARDLIEQRRDRGRRRVGPRSRPDRPPEPTTRSRGVASRPSVSSPSSPASGEEAPHVGQDLRSVVGVRRHPIDDDEQRQPALVDARQDGPRHLIGVARGGRHEDSTGRPPRRVGRSGPGWHARASRYPERRPGRDPARSRRRHETQLVGRQAGRGRRRRARRGRPGGPGRRRPGSSGAGRRSRSTARPAIVLKMVLLPAPVGPTRSTTSGASRDAARTRTWPLRWSASWRARVAAASLRGPRARRRSESASRRSTRARRSDVAVPITARG